jgi:hypothetical protein
MGEGEEHLAIKSRQGPALTRALTATLQGTTTKAGGGTWSGSAYKAASDHRQEQVEEWVVSGKEGCWRQWLRTAAGNKSVDKLIAQQRMRTEVGGRL